MGAAASIIPRALSFAPKIFGFASKAASFIPKIGGLLKGGGALNGILGKVGNIGKQLLPQLLGQLGQG